MTTTSLTEDLERNHVPYEAIEHPRTLSAAAEADAIGVPRTDVAKTIVLATGDGFARAALAACDRLDMRRVRQLFDDGEARLATETELAAAYPMFELGAVPPLGGPAGDRVLLDRRLADRDAIVVEAGTHAQSVRLKTADLLELTHAEIADLAE